MTVVHVSLMYGAVHCGNLSERGKLGLGMSLVSCQGVSDKSRLL